MIQCDRSPIALYGILSLNIAFILKKKKLNYWVKYFLFKVIATNPYFKLFQKLILITLFHFYNDFNCYVNVNLVGI